MFKVCHVTSAHQRYDVRIFRKECCSLAKANYEVFLVVNDIISKNEKKNGVTIISTGFSPSSRKERFFKSHKLIYREMEKIDADAYHFHDPDLLPLAVKMKKKGKKVVFDFHENVAGQIKDKKWIPVFSRHFVSAIYDRYEKYCVKKFDYLITVSPNIVKRLKKKNNRVVLITNFPLIESQYKEPTFQERNICFAGGISEQWCHGNILNAMEEIPDCKYILAGTVSKNYLEALKEKPSWEKVLYLGQIEFERVQDVYANSMAGMVLNISSQVGKEGTLGNTKLFEIMLAGIPIICSDNILWKEIIEKSECGIVVNPKEISEIKNAITFIFEHKEIAKKMGKNGRDCVLKQYTWRNEEKKLLHLYGELEKG